MTKQLHILIALLILSSLAQAQLSKMIESGIPWLDTDGKVIEAHGGGMMKVGNTYYWYGENHALGQGNKTGISCYSSADLMTWKNEGVVLPKNAMPEQCRDIGVVERPKVIYNTKTKKYVMWMHLDDGKYILASAGIAVADKPTGPFKFIASKRPISYDYGINNAAIREGYDPKEKENGNTYRDMNLFVDQDGRAYVFYASENNATMYVCLLNDEYTDIVRPAVEGKTWARIFVKGNREAPAPFRYKDKYFIFTSGLTGWAPNPASYATAPNILGPWETMGNPCIGPGRETTFRSQSTYVIQAPGKSSEDFIFMADRWVGGDLVKSTYVWLPFKITSSGQIYLDYIDKWDWSVFDAPKQDLQSPTVTVENVNATQKIRWKPVTGAAAYKIYKNGKHVYTTASLQYELPAMLAGYAYNYAVSAFHINGAASPMSTPVTIQTGSPLRIYLSEAEPSSYFQGFGTWKKDVNMDEGPIKINGYEFKKGVSSHANCELVYAIGGQYKTFEARIGRTIDFSEGAVQFLVYGDDKLLYKSELMYGKTPAELIQINVTGVSELKLVANDGGDGTHYDHISWADALLIP